MNTYTKTTWVDGTTKLSAANMNKIETGVEAATNGVTAVENSPGINSGKIYAYKNIGGGL